MQGIIVLLLAIIAFGCFPVAVFILCLNALFWLVVAVDKHFTGG
jgi:hypothetical protein